VGRARPFLPGPGGQHQLGTGRCRTRHLAIARTIGHSKKPRVCRTSSRADPSHITSLERTCARFAAPISLPKSDTLPNARSINASTAEGEFVSTASLWPVIASNPRHLVSRVRNSSCECRRPSGHQPQHNDMPFDLRSSVSLVLAVSRLITLSCALNVPWPALRERVPSSSRSQVQAQTASGAARLALGNRPWMPVQVSRATRGLLYLDAVRRSRSCSDAGGALERVPAGVNAPAAGSGRALALLLASRLPVPGLSRLRVRGGDHPWTRRAGRGTGRPGVLPGRSAGTGCPGSRCT
jgi:hypothetical protein